MKIIDYYANYLNNFNHELLKEELNIYINKSLANNIYKYNFRQIEILILLNNLLGK